MKYSCPIMGSGSLVNAGTDLQLTILLYLVYVLTVQDENKVTQSTLAYM